LGKDCESCVSKKQDYESGFDDPIGDDDSDTKTNILITKEIDLKTKIGDLWVQPSVWHKLF
jgi:hypothetical protein